MAIGDGLAAACDMCGADLLLDSPTGTAWRPEIGTACRPALGPALGRAPGRPCVGWNMIYRRSRHSTIKESSEWLPKKNMPKALALPAVLLLLHAGPYESRTGT
jgi:hypothetical protein